MCIISFNKRFCNANYNFNQPTINYKMSYKTLALFKPNSQDRLKSVSRAAMQQQHFYQ